MASQVTGYRYFANFLLFIGNPIEKVLGINFDKRGWISPLVDENGNALVQGVVAKQYLYGETEGGIGGAIHARYGTNNQDIVTPYKNYMESMELQASTYPFQSYLAFTGLNVPVVSTPPQNINQSEMLPFGANNAFYVGNSGYMKEMLLWPKRIHVRNDGREQWYDEKAEIAKIISGLELLKYMPTSNQLYTVDYFHVDNGGTTEVQLASEFPIVFLNFLNYSDGIATEIKTIVRHAPLMLFKVSGSIKPTYGDYLDANDAISVIGEQCSKITLTKRTDDFYFEFLATPDEFGNIGIIGRTPRSQSGLITNFTIYPSNSKGYGAATGDINPIHKIREILTDDTAMNKLESSVNNVNFMKAADRIWDEGLGISWSITEKSCIDAINELCYHIEAGIRVNRQTGLYEMVLFRDNWFEENEIHTISENKIKKGSMQYEITNADEVINQVNVNYYDRENIKNSSFSISESGLIQTLGRVNAETVDFPYFMNMRNAEIVANWKLKILSTGVLKGSFTTGWREARKWNRYDLIKLPWSKRWVGNILVRIMSINLGGPTNNEVSIEFVEVVPSTGMMNTTIVVDDVIDKPLPPQACQYEPFEMPYYLAVMALGQRKADEELAYESNFGLVGTVAEKPQENSLYAVMMTNNYDEWIRAGSIQYSLTADSDQIISKTSSSFTVKNWKKISNVPAGTLIQCGKEWLTGLSEWMVFQGIDPNTGVVSVKRGALDTQPQQWDLGLKLYFCGTDIAYDATEYVAGEKVLVSALTTTPSGVLEQKGSNLVEMKARAIRPYPPANVKINGEYWPTEIETDLIITWVDRNRTQQTGGGILGWYEGGVTPESGVTYQLVLTERDENDVELRTQNLSLGVLNMYTFETSAMNANTRTIHIVLRSLRDGYESYQAFDHAVELSQFFSAPYNLTVEYVE